MSRIIRYPHGDQGQPKQQNVWKTFVFLCFLLYPIGYSINLMKQVVFPRLGRDPHRKRELPFHGNSADTKHELPSVTMVQRTSSGSYKTRKNSFLLCIYSESNLNSGVVPGRTMGDLLECAEMVPLLSMVISNNA